MSVDRFSFGRFSIKLHMPKHLCTRLSSGSGLLTGYKTLFLLLSPLSFFLLLYFPIELGLKLSFVMENRAHVDMLKLILLLLGISRYLVFLDIMHYGRLAMMKPWWLEIVPRDAPLC